MLSLIPDESLDRLKTMFGTTFATFDQLEIEALVTADIEGFVDNTRMCQITDKHPSDITKLLQTLVSKGVLIQDSKGRWARYFLPKKEHSAYIEQLAENQSSKLKKLANIARENTRLQPEIMEELILELCQGQWLTRKQLGDLLKRNIDALRTRFLTPMVRHGLLKLKYPEKPNRTDQAYTSQK